MSYEGREQLICTNGHYYEIDCHSSQICKCGADAAWVNGIDDTNCDAYGEILFETLKERFMISDSVIETCNLDHKHLTKEAVFRIPSRKETEGLRGFRDYRQTNPPWHNFTEWDKVWKGK